MTPAPDSDTVARDAPGRRVRVFLVDDHRLFLAGVRAELGDSV